MYALSTSSCVSVFLRPSLHIFVSWQERNARRMNWTRYGFGFNYDAIILQCIALHILSSVDVEMCAKIRCIFYLHLIAIHNKFSNLAQTFELHVVVEMSHALQNCRTCSAPQSTSILVVDFVLSFFFLLLLPFPLFLSKHLFSFTFILFFINVCHYTILS